jgi:hypothetical protein
MSSTDDLRRLMDCERRLAAQTKASDWPEGTLARYLTVGGATVDITQRRRYINDDRLVDGIATCTGCGDSERADHVDPECSGGPEWALERNTNDARRWAQDHASTCRAMPKPGGAR